MASSVRQRKVNSKKNNKSNTKSRNKSQNGTKSHRKSSNKTQPLIPLPIIFRVLIASMFLFSIYIFKQYYLPKILNENEMDFSQIINSEDIDFTKTKLKEISPRFSGKKTKKIPPLRLWNIDDFWTKQMALNISNTLYQEFMDETQRNKSFYFAVNRGNEKIRGNDDIPQKTVDAKEKMKRNGFSYCKYEYRRQLPLYQRVLSYLNSSYVVNIMSKILKKEILGVSDLFISIYYKDNFLSMHDDRGLGHYAFVNFLSQNWNHAQYGGSLNFNCQDRRNWKQSCFELKPNFNQIMLFKVWPEAVPHFVKEVTVELPRTAITGWYFTSDPRGIHWASIAEETGYGLK